MLAAAGGPDVDPHAGSTPAEHALWDHGLANFSGDLQLFNSFFMDIIDGKFPNRDAIGEKGSKFYGVQGPSYTVGYKMAAMVEKRFGRQTLIETMLDPRCLLALHNRAASDLNADGKQQLPLWSDSLLASVGAKSCGLLPKGGTRGQLGSVVNWGYIQRRAGARRCRTDTWR